MDSRKVYSTKRYKRYGGYAITAFIIEKKFILIGIAAAVVVVILFFFPGVLINHDNDKPVHTIPPVVTAKPTATPSASAVASATPQPSATSTPVVFNRVLKYTTPNMQGDDVWALQEKLGLKPDGYFGKSTQAALIKFQLKHGLTGDGVAGDTTLQKLGLK